MSKVPIDRETIQTVAQLIAQKFDPEQIILFGSHARGNAGSHSDIDLLVVPASLDSWPKRDNPIRRAIREQFILPVDVLVTTHDRLAEQRNNPYSFSQHRSRIPGNPVCAGRVLNRTGSKRQHKTWKWPLEM